MKPRQALARNCRVGMIWALMKDAIAICIYYERDEEIDTVGERRRENTGRGGGGDDEECITWAGDAPPAAYSIVADYLLAAR